MPISLSPSQIKDWVGSVLVIGVLEGNIETSIIQSAMKKYDLDPEKPSPITV